jgi:glycosyltransferase involved in cell wall biosynthesis
MALDVAGTESLIRRLQRAGTKIVWTAHDLIPHNKDYARYEPIFALWAEAADGMIHHSRSGEELIRARYDFRPDCEHVTIMEAFSRDHDNLALRDRRSDIERKYGLAPAKIRIGIVGNPRVERKVLDFLEGVCESSNHDIQVVCWSLRPTETAPTDPRIAIAEPWSFVEDEVITERLAMCDLLALPITPDGEMLTTGLVPDAFGMGLGMLISSWNFLIETTQDAGIHCGDGALEIARSLDRLSEGDVLLSKSASVRIRDDRNWTNAGAQHLAFYERIHMREPSRGPSGRPSPGEATSA